MDSKHVPLKAAIKEADILIGKSSSERLETCRYVCKKEIKQEKQRQAEKMIATEPMMFPKQLRTKPVESKDTPSISKPCYPTSIKVLGSLEKLLEGSSLNLKEFIQTNFTVDSNGVLRLVTSPKGSGNAARSGKKAAKRKKLGTLDMAAKPNRNAVVGRKPGRKPRQQKTLTSATVRGVTTSTLMHEQLRPPMGPLNPPTTAVVPCAVVPSATVQGVTLMHHPLNPPTSASATVRVTPSTLMHHLMGSLNPPTSAAVSDSQSRAAQCKPAALSTNANLCTPTCADTPAVNDAVVHKHIQPTDPQNPPSTCGGARSVASVCTSLQGNQEVPNSIVTAEAQALKELEEIEGMLSLFEDEGPGLGGKEGSHKEVEEDRNHGGNSEWVESVLGDINQIEGEQHYYTNSSPHLLRCVLNKRCPDFSKCT
jgi:hypothetical protein